MKLTELIELFEAAGRTEYGYCRLKAFRDKQYWEIGINDGNEAVSGVIASNEKYITLETLWNWSGVTAGHTMFELLATLVEVIKNKDKILIDADTTCEKVVHINDN